MDTADELETELTADERALLDELAERMANGRLSVRALATVGLSAAALSTFAADLPGAMTAAFGAGATLAAAATVASATTSILFLEASKPLAFVGSQTMLLLRPMIRLFVREPTKYDRIQALLEKRGSIELLVRRIEARS